MQTLHSRSFLWKIPLKIVYCPSLILFQNRQFDSTAISTILFVALGCGVIPIVPRLQVSSSLDISIARTATAPMSILTSKHRLTFLTSLSWHVLAVTVPVKGLWEHLHTPLSAVRGLCFPLC